MEKAQLVFERLCRALRGHGLAPTTEAEFQQAVCRLLQKGGVGFAEQVIDGRNRYDLVMVEGGVVLELKIKGTLARLIRQLDRYAKREDCQFLVVVTTRRQLLRLPASLHGKPVEAIFMGSV